MSRIDPERRLTRAERLVTVVAVVGAVLLHVVVLFGWGRLFRWAQEEQKKERLMVIRRVREIAPPPDASPAPRPREAPVGTEGRAGGKHAAPPPPADAKVREKGPEPPKAEETSPKPEELSPKMEEDLRQGKPEQAKEQESAENSVNVVTDLQAATFTVSGSSEYRGAGTFWVRKGLPPGVYTVTFNPVAGFATPPVQSKNLPDRGQIVFVGRYRKSVEVVIESNVPTAGVTVFRPGGRQLEITGVGTALFDDLTPGAYTAVFQPVPGYVAPPPVVQTLAPGASRLVFRGEYRGAAVAAATPGARAPASSSAREDGAAAARAPARPVRRESGPREAELDRRVQVIVKSYPPTGIEEDHDPIAYPELVIRRSKFQQGWCQVYLVLEISDRGQVRNVTVERPRPEERPQFEALIKAVEEAVAAWDYDKVRAEVHVDARFYVE